MSYQVLARKWRPSNFTQVAGQSHVLKSLINALDNQRLHHAYLFTGTRGVGKTTLARILAKCLNCEEGVSSTPCEKCDSCNEINQGRFIDLIEVDAASRTKVEDTRELLENVQYTPTRGRYKVYLIDEVHMLSNHSFNALLKTLEEPPPHVKFLFATTDPQKLPITILSRCLQFNLKNLSPELIVNYLQTVLDSEEIAYVEEALWQIAAAAAGSMRDALTLVDQAIAYCQGDIKAQGVIEMLGVPEQRQVYELLECMAQRDASRLLQLITQMAEQTPDYAHTLDSLLTTLHRIALAQVVKDAIDNSYGDKEQVLQLAGQFSAEDIQLYYQIGNKGRDELRMAADLRAAFEMLLLRMLLFSPDYESGSVGETTANNDEVAPGAGIAEKKKTDERLEATTEPPVSSQVTPASDATDQAPRDQEASEQIAASTMAHSESRSAQTTTSHLATNEVARAEAKDEAKDVAKIQAAPATEATNSAVGTDTSVDTVPSVGSGATQSAASNQAAPAPAADVAKSAPAISEPITLAMLAPENWVSLYSQLEVTGIAANVIANTELLQVDGSQLSLRLDETQSAVYSDDIVPRISQVLAAHFAEPVELSIEIGQVVNETPAQQGQRIRQETYEQMVDEFEQDEHVQELTRRFSGRVARESIAPLED